ncbi:hypothetical protein [Sphingomonas yabuuchiae]|uniref:Uncharacterized protein n=1 Tax=Sphingomonas yabuuchiae TaxID=172044 RepID=A0AA40ZY02_9SPHN|nr:hypothetical protein [Sphingomonas yabuuchiae]MBN3557094.1 hypothetical protein [Sphingomonas yabuuchiae]
MSSITGSPPPEELVSAFTFFSRSLRLVAPSAASAWASSTATGSTAPMIDPGIRLPVTVTSGEGGSEGGASCADIPTGIARPRTIAVPLTHPCRRALPPYRIVKPLPSPT